MSPEETRDWLDALHGFKSANLQRLQCWLKSLQEAGPGPRHLQIKLAEAQDLVMVFNDHRLMLAAQHDIGQEQMDLGWLDLMTEMPPRRRKALFEIHHLATIIECILGVLTQKS